MSSDQPSTKALSTQSSSNLSGNKEAKAQINERLTSLSTNSLPSNGNHNNTSTSNTNSNQHQPVTKKSSFSISVSDHVTKPLPQSSNLILFKAKH